MSNFKDVINIGKVLAQRLEDIEINNLGELHSAGSQKAILQLAANNVDVCINMLYAMEGAIKGVRWHLLTKEEKLELKEFFNENFINQT